jgi:hypothetical protein
MILQRLLSSRLLSCGAFLQYAEVDRQSAKDYDAVSESGTGAKRILFLLNNCFFPPASRFAKTIQKVPISFDIQSFLSVDDD